MVSEEQLINVSLRISPSAESVLPSRTGFWLDHCDLEAWLTAMLRSESACGGEVDFYVLPPSIHIGSARRSDQKFGGLIGLPKCEQPLHHHAFGIPLVPVLSNNESSRGESETRQLWILTSAQLQPAVPTHWLAEVLKNASFDAEAFAWIPQIGLVSLEAQDRLTVKELVSKPRSFTTAPQSKQLNAEVSLEPVKAFDCGHAEWIAPLELPVLPDRVTGFRLIGHAATSDPLSDLADQFGQKSDELWREPLSDDPAETGQQGGLLGNGKEWLLKKMEKWFAPGDDTQTEPSGDSQGRGRAGHGAKRSQHAAGGRQGTGKARKRGLSAYMFAKLAKSVEQQRQQQLSKLMEMLKRDPDRALQFAIPLAGDGKFRGLAVPGSKLLSRFPEFSLSGLSGGGGPVDAWSMNYAYQKQLRESYLELANREVAIGRHRRAAYIYAHLLGDFAAAAGVLEQGKFYREAAMLYQDKLKRKSDAARCFLQAGMCEQAVEIYESLNDYENVAAAWHLAGREDKVHESYERAVHQCIAAGRVMDAVNILTAKLEDRERAMALLWEQWPQGREALPCMLLYFGMLSFDHQNDFALAQLQSVIQSASRSDCLDLARLLKHLSHTFPHTRIQQLAYDHARLAISRACQYDERNSHTALTLLRELEESDSLLKHDCFRYLAEQKKQLANAKTGPQKVPATNTELKLLGNFLLQRKRHVFAHIVSKSLLVYRKDGDRLIAEFYDIEAPDGLNRTVPLTRSTEQVFAVNENAWKQFSHYKSDGKEQLFAIRPNDEPESGDIEIKLGANTKCVVSNKFPAALNHCETLLGTSPNLWCGLEFTHGSWHLKTCGVNSENLRYWRLDKTQIQPDYWDSDQDTDPGFGVLSSEKPPIGLLTHIDQLPIAVLEKSLISALSGFGKEPRIASIPGRAYALAVAAPGTRKRIAVAHEKGLMIAWPEYSEIRTLVACNEYAYQHVLWMQGGRLFAVGDGQLTRFHVRYLSAQSHGTARLRNSPVIGLVPFSPSVCAVVYEDGVIECY